jgi:ribonuclease VapC
MVSRGNDGRRHLRIGAILREEPGFERFVEVIASAPERFVSTVALLEASMVLESRLGPRAVAELDLFVLHSKLKTISFDEHHLEAAKLAFRRFGKGRHPAGLNFGDCCVYSLAKALGEPVLCKGDDFRKTDIEVVDIAE